MTSVKELFDKDSQWAAVIIKKCVFKYNSAAKFGGALLLKNEDNADETEADVEDSLFVHNEATQLGQAILLEDYTRRISNVTVITSSKNQADDIHIMGTKVKTDLFKVTSLNPRILSNKFFHCNQ